jgi:hypothetical protein
MVAVTVVGMAVRAYWFWERQRICRATIYFHSRSEDCDSSDADSPPQSGICGMMLDSMALEVKRHHSESLPSRAEYRAGCLRNAAYHARVKQKFQQAARRIWEALPDDQPDPPGP